MREITKMIELVQTAYHKADEAHKAWNDYLAFAREQDARLILPGANDMTESVISFMRFLTETCTYLSGIRDEERKRFDDATILQARIVHDGQVRKVACSKPNDHTDCPWISEGVYNALRKTLGVAPGEELRTEEDYEIAVLNTLTKRTVATIAR